MPLPLLPIRFSAIQLYSFPEFDANRHLFDKAFSDEKSPIRVFLGKLNQPHPTLHPAETLTAKLAYQLEHLRDLPHNILTPHIGAMFDTIIVLTGAHAKTPIYNTHGCLDITG